MGRDGRQVWVDRNEIAFTCDKPETEELPLQTLTYLAAGSNKAVYQEHSIDDEDSKKGKKKDKQAGRSRGFIVRVDQEDRARVMNPFQACVDKLVRDGTVSRVDVDDSDAQKKREKKGRGAKEKEEPPEEVVGIPLAPNEVRVEVVGRCQHQAHGVGFTLIVSEIGAQQKLHVFTNNKEIPTSAWHKSLVEALLADGSKVMLGRMSPATAPDPPDIGKDGKSKKDVAKADEDEWLASIMGRCMVKNEKEKQSRSSDGDREGTADGESSLEQKAPPKAPVNLPPWLRKA